MSCKKNLHLNNIVKFFCKRKKIYKTIVARFYVKSCKDEKHDQDDKPNKCLTKLDGE
jgi:hypothetical protein